MRILQMQIKMLSSRQQAWLAKEVVVLLLALDIRRLFWYPRSGTTAIGHG